MAKVTLDRETFKALASETRLELLRGLDERRKTGTELARDLDLNKATVHEHLQVLHAVGLVKKLDEGRKWIYYELSWQGRNLLHPETGAVFNVLLGLSTLAAGGSIVTMGKALGWWLSDRGTRSSGASDDGSAAETAGVAMAEEADMDASGDASDEGAPPNDGSPESSPEAAEADRAGTNETFVEELPGDDGALHDGMSMDGGLSFLDDGGWLTIGLWVAFALFLGLALLLRFRHRSGRHPATPDPES